MATKKEKRQRGLERHARYMAEIKAAGLRALSKDKENRHKKALSEWQDNHDKNHSRKKRIAECPHCQLAVKAELQLESTSN